MTIDLNAPFRVIPALAASPLIVEIPHAGTHVPARYQSLLRAPIRSLSRDADLHVDSLYLEAHEALTQRGAGLGASFLIAHWSRLVLDLNRAENAVDAESVQGAPRTPTALRGAIWRATSDKDAVLTRALTAAEYQERLDSIHRPYHRALQALIREKQAAFGYAVVLAAHSMPSAPRAADASAAEPRAEVVPGTRGRTSAAANLIDAVDQVARALGFSVAHDVPYRGGFTTEHYGRPKESCHVIQIELSRAVYMDEQSHIRTPKGTERSVRLCSELMQKLSQTPPQ
jgi:N-formylglutamate deformylase